MDTVNLDGPYIAADVTSVIGTVMQADSGSSTVLLFGICWLKQFLLLSAA